VTWSFFFFKHNVSGMFQFSKPKNNCGNMQMKLSISVEDVKREVRILQTLSGHKNIVQFYAAFEDDDKVYIVME